VGRPRGDGHRPGHGQRGDASKIAETWKGTEERPLRALRLSRLSRYLGKLDDADKYSQLALGGGTVTTRSLTERVFVLAARDKPQDAGPLLAKYPLVLGALSGWLSGYARAVAGKEETPAVARPASSRRPHRRPLRRASSPLPHWRDARSAPRRRLREGPLRRVARHPDTVAAGTAFGLKPPARPAPKKK